MKFITATVLLATTVSALQSPIPKAAKGCMAAATIATSTLLAGPLSAPAANNDVVVAPTAVVVNINTDSTIDPIAAAKNLFVHRQQLQDAVKDFLADVKQLSHDLDGVFPPAPNVAIAIPEDWKQAVRDALVGQARLVVNDKPVYFEIDSKEGFLTVKVLSPILPQIPFLEPTPEQRASMVIPRPPIAPVASTTTTAPVALTTPPSAGIPPFWEWSFTVPTSATTSLDVTLPEAVLGVIAAAYGTTFGYYVLSNALEEQQAAQKKQANAEKAKAAAAAAAKAKAAAADAN